MGKNVTFTIVMVFLIVADVSNAAFLWNFRKLVAPPSKEHPNNSTDPPLLSPILPEKQSSPVGNEKLDDSLPASTAGNDNSKDKQVPKNANVTPPPVDDANEHSNNTQKDDETKKENGTEEKEEEKEKENEKSEEQEEQKEEQKEKEKEKSKTNLPVGGGESCDGMERRCQVLKSMTACIKSVDRDSTALVLLIQNKGNSSLNVDITALPSGSKQKVTSIPKLQSKQVNVPLADGTINEISLDASSGHCVLHLGAPASQGNFFRNLPSSYSKFMTPVYGAYLILLITFIAGGVWICCWFRKRKRQRDIPYQELEMSMPESAVVAETAEGWDEVWDDDWDEEKAVRTPGGHNSISANGLTSRNPKKDEWEDWDD